MQPTAVALLASAQVNNGMPTVYESTIRISRFTMHWLGGQTKLTAVDANRLRSALGDVVSSDGRSTASR